MMVIDSTAVLELLLFRSRAERTISDLLIEHPREELIAPTQLDQDLLKTLSHYLDQGEITPQRAHELLKDVEKLRIERHVLNLNHALDNPQARRLVHQLGVDAASYLLLAQEQDAKLITCDPQLKAVAKDPEQVYLAA